MFPTPTTPFPTVQTSGRQPLNGPGFRGDFDVLPGMPFPNAPVPSPYTPPPFMSAAPGHTAQPLTFGSGIPVAPGSATYQASSTPFWPGVLGHTAQPPTFESGIPGAPVHAPYPAHPTPPTTGSGVLTANPANAKVNQPKIERVDPALLNPQPKEGLTPKKWGEILGTVINYHLKN